MEKIKLKNIQVYAFHGCLKEEAKIGSNYRIDLIVKGNLKHSAKTDKLVDTIDYVLLNYIVKEEMATRSNLLESVAQRIISRLFLEIPLIRKAKVSVAKINPPIDGNVEKVIVELSKKR